MPTSVHSRVVIAGVYCRAALKGLSIASFPVGSAPPGKAKRTRHCREPHARAARMKQLLGALGLTEVTSVVRDAPRP